MRRTAGQLDHGTKRQSNRATLARTVRFRLLTTDHRLRTNRAFTMVEIAICLAVIGFALVAIIGILPMGMQVQKDNRQQTIINQDARVFLDAIRGGARGFDDLTNYVLAITNYYAIYTSGGKKPLTGTAGYTVNDSFDTLAPGAPKFPIDSGNRIVGLLSTPKYIDQSANQGVSFRSNHFVAFVRAMSGPASEKFPQTNSAVQDAAFTYRMYVDLVPYSDFDTNWVNYTAYLSNTNGEWQWRSNYWSFAHNLQNQLFDLRLTFRWPLTFNWSPGNERQAYRTLAGGMLTVTNDSGNVQNPGNALKNYFLEPRLYATSTNNVLTGQLNQFFPQVP